MRLHRVNLGGLAPWLWANQGDLSERQKSWTQPPGHWSLFLLDHNGIATVNNKPIPFNAGQLAFIVPGGKIEFDRVGPNTACFSMTFEILPRHDVVAIPAVADLGDTKEQRREEVQSAFDWLQFSIMPVLACAHHLLWSIAQPISHFRKSDLVFDAESLIIKRLAEPIRVAELAQELGISHVHLLRLFREEHNCTIQEFIREKRAEVARQLITGSPNSLKEIAVQCGMPDLQHFNKVIRATTGLSPRALRLQAETRAKH